MFTKWSKLSQPFPFIYVLCLWIVTWQRQTKEEMTSIFENIYLVSCSFLRKSPSKTRLTAANTTPLPSHPPVVASTPSSSCFSYSVSVGSPLFFSGSFPPFPSLPLLSSYFLKMIPFLPCGRAPQPFCGRGRRIRQSSYFMWGENVHCQMWQQIKQCLVTLWRPRANLLARGISHS